LMPTALCSLLCKGVRSPKKICLTEGLFPVISLPFSHPDLILTSFLHHALGQHKTFHVQALDGVPLHFYHTRITLGKSNGDSKACVRVQSCCTTASSRLAGRRHRAGVSTLSRPSPALLPSCLFFLRPPLCVCRFLSVAHANINTYPCSIYGKIYDAHIKHLTRTGHTHRRQSWRSSEGSWHCRHNKQPSCKRVLLPWRLELRLELMS
jgi:hypothetical protein